MSKQGMFLHAYPTRASELSVSTDDCSSVRGSKVSVPLQDTSAINAMPAAAAEIHFLIAEILHAPILPGRFPDRALL